MGSPERATQVAIECLSLWLDPGTEARQAAAEHITDLVADPDIGHLVVPGLLNLAMFLAFELAKRDGATTQDEYQERARAYLKAYGLGLAQRDE